MAAARLISGKLREIWRESAHQPNVAQPVTTGIRIAAEQLSRVRAQITLDAMVGLAAVTALATVSAAGFLVITVTNGAPGTTVDWTLDVQLTHSHQQAMDPVPGAYISIVNGAGVGGGVPLAQNLFQTYNFGAVSADQTMVISTALGGGVIVEAATAAVTGAGAALDIRQSSAFETPLLIERAGNIATGPRVQFQKSEGTIAIPVQVAQNDALGVLDFYGYTAGVFVQASRIYSWVSAVAAGPGFELSTAIDFEASAVGVRAALFRMTKLSAAGGGNLFCIGDGVIQPDVNHEGSVGHPYNANAWSKIAGYDCYALTNMYVGGYTGGGAATHTIVLANDSVLPAPTASHVYIGSVDFSGDLGTDLAVLAISAEEPEQPIDAHVADTLIPIVYNGHPYYLLAMDNEFA